MASQHLNAEELAALKEHGVLLEQTIPGKRKISASFLTPSNSGSSSSFSSFSSSSTSSSRAVSGSIKIESAAIAVDRTMDLPEVLDSAEGVEFIGFRSSTALAIFTKFKNRPHIKMNPDTLFDYIESHVLKMRGDSWQTLSDAQIMEGLGIKEKVAAAILDPKFHQIYGTASLHYWLMDTLYVNYLTLSHLLDNLKRQAIAVVIYGKSKKKAKSQSSSHPPVSVLGSASPQKSSAGPVITLSSTSTENILQNCNVVQNTPIVLPNHTILYKGKASAELNDPPEQLLLPNGDIHFHCLNTPMGGDFNARREAQYWTPEYACAQLYRQYAAERCEDSETWLLCVQVPNTFLSGLRTETLNYSNPWKDYVWLCRKKTLNIQIPLDFHRFSHHADLVKGHICFRSSKHLVHRSRDDARQQIGPADVLELEGFDVLNWCLWRKR